MKRLIHLLLLLCAVATASAQTIDLRGAWESGPEENRITWICSDKYFAASVYNLKEKKYIGACGGSWRLEGSTFVEVHEFNTLQPEFVGQEIKHEIALSGGKLIFKLKDKQEAWTRIDSGKPGEMAGAWLITGRMVDGKLQAITPAARKTMKILSGTRFQWIAYNSETKEFFGTGGGTYTSKDGKYTENILFFSRDNTRVGVSLQFDFSWENGNWRHKGFSSKGEPIDEVWTKREKLGI